MGCFSSNEKPKKITHSSYEGVSNQQNNQNNNLNNVNSGNTQVNLNNQQLKKVPSYSKGKSILVCRQDK